VPSPAQRLNTGALFGALELASKRHERLASVLQQDAAARDGGGQILGTSAPIQRVRQDIELVARSDFAVLITGETGVGKEPVARAVHDASTRHSEPLIYVNCAALPETIVESELFGHVRGAFTGANADRAGKFEVADRGTLFLDEVGELPLSVQPKLLRALQQGEVQRVGSDQTLRVNVRVVAATNRDLPREVDAGRFRADLFHRLNMYPIHVPPLRERRSDIRCSPATSSMSTGGGWAWGPYASPRRPGAPSPPRPGPGTCASSTTCSVAPCCGRAQVTLAAPRPWSDQSTCGSPSTRSTRRTRRWGWRRARRSRTPRCGRLSRRPSASW
jgi:hypothetical protein